VEANALSKSLNNQSAYCCLSDVETCPTAAKTPSLTLQLNFASFKQSVNVVVALFPEVERENP